MKDQYEELNEAEQFACTVSIIPLYYLQQRGFDRNTFKK